MALQILGDSDDDELLDEDEATTELGYKNKRTLKRWRDLGIGPAYTQISRKYYYRRGAIRDWVRNNEVTA